MSRPGLGTLRSASTCPLGEASTVGPRGRSEPTDRETVGRPILAEQRHAAAASSAVAPSTVPDWTNPPGDAHSRPDAAAVSRTGSECVEPRGTNGRCVNVYARRGSGLEFEMEVAWVRRHLPRNMRILLDVGCGNGRLLASVSDVRRIGLDAAGGGLVQARNHDPNAWFGRALADHLPLADGTVDAIVAQHLVEHLGDVDAAMREWRRVLRRNGVLLMLTPNAAFADPSIFEDPTHVRLYHAERIRGTVARARFAVVDLRSIGLPWLRDYRRYPGGWRLRRFVTTYADTLSRLPRCRWRGQTLCCAAIRSEK